MRLEGQAIAGEYPAPVSVVRFIAAMLAVPAPERTTVCDPFGSNGRALNTLAAALGIPSAGRYLAELKPANVEQALADGVGHAVALDTFTELRASPGSMSLVWTNPPFDWTNGGLHAKGERGLREELRALRLILSPYKLSLLPPGGIHVVIAPEDILLRADMREELAKWHDDITAWTFPLDERPFREVVVIGVKRAKARDAGDDLGREMDLLYQQIVTARPLEPELPVRYTVPPCPRTGAIVWRHRQISAALDTAQQIIKTGGIWAAQGWQHARAALRQYLAPPLAPFNPEQAALMVASGRFNNREIELDGVPYLVKGFTSQKTHETTTTADGHSSRVTTTERIEIPHPMIALRNLETGAITIYDGMDPVMQFVSQHADAFLQMAQQAAPSVYTPAAPNPAVWQVLEGITSHSGRKPRGASKPGLVTQQKHAAAAIVAGLTQPHPLTGKPLNGVVAALEQRTGKSAVSLGVAETLRQLDPTPARQGRAFTALVPAPRLVVGSKAQIAKALKGKAPLPAWYALWQDMLPDWKLWVLETPGDLGDFFRSAHQHPTVPHAAFVPLSMLALAPGWNVMPAPSSRSARARDRRFAQADAEQAARMALVKGDESDVPDPAPAGVSPAPALDAAGVSPRTQRRDALLRPSYRPRQAGGLACPDCGRVQTDEEGDTITGVDTMQEASCIWCGQRFAGWTRAVQAKERAAIFRAWQGDFSVDPATGARSIPWGTRPTSNPRVPLAWLLKQQYRGQLDLIIFDEVHKAKGDGTAIGDAMLWAATAARKVVYLTGTVFGGNPLDVFNIYWSIGNPLLRQQFGWSDRSLFVDVMGVKKTILTETTPADKAGIYNGRTTKRTQTEALPGLTISLLELVLTQTVMMQLTDMGFDLVPLTERRVLLDMPADVEATYGEAVEVYQGWLKKRRMRAASSAMQMLWQYPYRPEAPKAMSYTPRDPDTGEEGDPITWTPEARDPQLLPHHTWLADYIVAQRQAGRRVLVYCTHTGDDNLIPSVEAGVREAAAQSHRLTLTAAQLYSDRDHQGQRVDPGARDAWFRDQAAAGVDVVYANPQCLDVGISLLDFASIVFLEPHYSAFVVSQAMMRAWGPMQDHPCEVVFVAYRTTVSQAALALLAQKLAAMATLKGSIAKAIQGIAEFSGAMSMFKAIAELVSEGRTLEVAGATSAAPSALPAARPAAPVVTTTVSASPLFSTTTVQLQVKGRGATKPTTVAREQWTMNLNG